MKIGEVSKLLSLKGRFASYSPRKYRLLADFSAHRQKSDFDRRIPDPSLNYNQRGTHTYGEYYREFVSQAVLRELPEFLRIASFSPSDETFSMLDYGCGLGRLAFAFTNFFGSDPRRRYVGHEIHAGAYAFLLDAYRDFSNVSFLHDQLALDESYAEIAAGDSTATRGSKSAEAATVELSTRIGYKLDLQVTYSVFTHMYRKAIVHVLREFNSLMKPGGVCVNTWQIMDQFAMGSVRCGLADRVLPIHVKDEGFFTYSQKNPLVCTVYEWDVIKSIYEAADHEIVDVQWGTWSGRIPTQEITYQDVIVSKPKAHTVSASR